MFLGIPGGFPNKLTSRPRVRDVRGYTAEARAGPEYGGKTES